MSAASDEGVRLASVRISKSVDRLGDKISASLAGVVTALGTLPYRWRHAQSLSPEEALRVAGETERELIAKIRELFP